MSHKPLSAEDIEAQSQDIDQHIANLTSQLGDMKFDDHNDTNIDDVSVDDDDLAALEGSDNDDDNNNDGDFIDIGKDADFDGLMTDDDEASMDESLFDDPNFLDKLEKMDKGKAQDKKSSAPSKQPAAPKPSTSASAPVTPATKPPAQSNKPPATRSKAPSGNATATAAATTTTTTTPAPAPAKVAPPAQPSASKPAAATAPSKSSSKTATATATVNTPTATPTMAGASLAETKQTVSEINALSAQVKDNIARIDDYIKYLEGQCAANNTDENSKAKLNKYMAIRGKCQVYSSMLTSVVDDWKNERAKWNKHKNGLPPVLVCPSYDHITIPIGIETINESIHEDHIEIECLNITNITSTRKYYIKLIADIGGDEQCVQTASVKGKGIIILNDTQKIQLPPKARNSRGLQTILRRLKIRCELWSAGLMWSDMIAIGEIRCGSILSNKCDSLHNMIKLSDPQNQRDIIGTVEINVRVRRPFVTKDMTDGTLQIVRILATPPTPQSQPQQQQQQQQQQPTQTTSEPAIPDTVVSAPATPAPATASATPATTANGLDTAGRALTGQPLLIHLGFPSLRWKEDVIISTSVVKCPSFDAMTAEIEAMEKLMPLMTKSGIKPPNPLFPTAEAVKDRLQELVSSKDILELRVTSEQLSMDGYLDILRKAIEYDKEIGRALVKIFQYYDKCAGIIKSQADKDSAAEDAIEFKARAMHVRNRLLVMQAELKGAEEGGDELDE